MNKGNVQHMRFSAIARVLGVLLMVFSLSMVPPIGISMWYHDGAEFSFISVFFITFLAGFITWYPFRSREYELKTRDGFLVVFLFWTVLSIFGALPFCIQLFPHMSFTDGMFETVSGLTTTGATIFVNLDHIPRSILYYRQQLHLLGGMGIIVLAVAVLPMLGVGGMQLYRAETVGPIKTSKLRPRMAQTAKSLWYIYVGLVVICAACYWGAGMKLFDAIGESFSTISTGGFSMHDNSFAYYHSSLINIISTVFMILGACNFSLYFQFLKTGKISIFTKDSEFVNYLGFLAIVSAIIFITLAATGHLHHGNGLVNSMFMVASMSSTTGFTTVNINAWPTFLPYLIMLVALLGGCGGSTAGGLKIIRALILKEQGKRELRRLIHPQAVFAIKLGDQILSENIIEAIRAFFFFFIFLFVFLLLVLLADGLGIRTAFGALASCFANTGAAIGSVANNFEHIPSFSKWVLIFSMIAGRLEIFTVLVLFTRDYWRR